MSGTDSGGSLFSENAAEKENDRIIDTMSEMAWWGSRTAAAEVVRLRDALAAAQAENARLREALRDIARHWNDDLPMFEMAHQLYAAASVARSALGGDDATR